MNSLLKKIFTGKNALYIILIFIISLVTRLLFLKSFGVVPFSDTASYLETAADLFQINSIRLPVYPVFISACQHLASIANMDYKYFIIAFQMIISSFTAVQIYFISRKLMRSMTWSFITTVIITLNIFIFSWDYTILSESITLFLLITFVNTIFTYFEKLKLIYLIMAGFTLILMLYTKPFYLFLSPFIAIFIIHKAYFVFHKRNFIKIAVSICSFLIFIYLTVLLYSFANYQTNGFFGVSKVTNINLFGKIVYFDMQKYGDNQKLINDVGDFLEKNSGAKFEPFAFVSDYGWGNNNYKEVKDFSMKIILDHPLEYIGKNLNLAVTDPIYGDIFRKSDGLALFRNGAPGYNFFVSIFLVADKICILFFAAIIYLFYLLLFKKEKIYGKVIYAVISIFLVAYQYLVSIFGSYSDFSRLMMPVYPLLFIISLYVVKNLYDVLAVTIRHRVIRKSEYNLADSSHL